jgi:hypothetical protein
MGGVTERRAGIVNLHTLETGASERALVVSLHRYRSTDVCKKEKQMFKHLCKHLFFISAHSFQPSAVSD